MKPGRAEPAVIVSPPPAPVPTFSGVRTLSVFVQRHLLWLLIGAYVVAAFFPRLGLWIRDVSFGNIIIFGQDMRISLLMILLALLLFNAGLGMPLSEVRNLAGSRMVVSLGLVANIGIPLAYIVAMTGAMQWWHNPDETQTIIVGLALVASMPIAGSSTAWAQNADGNLALSLGLVLFSTLLSPIVAPLALHAIGTLTRGDYATTLQGLAAYSTGAFLGAWVVLPALLGMATRPLLGAGQVAQMKPILKLLNAGVLLALNYSNASVSLPQAVAHPDVDFLLVLFIITLGLCVTTFGAAYGLGRVLQTDDSITTSLMYGLGMNNNGTALVLAALAFSEFPRVMLPIIFYNLVQHLVAATVYSLRRPVDG